MPHSASLKLWADFVPALQQGKHVALLQRIAALRQEGRTIYPAQQDIFQALELVKPQDVRVIILGQDPYHGPNQAHGLAFSVPQNTEAKAIPPSLKNIFKEIYSDIYAKENPLHKPPYSPQLASWAKQGVLLLNTVLTVEHGKAHSHANLGWKEITQDILHSLAKKKEPLAVLLWGKAAQSYAPLFLDGELPAQHLVLTAAHPSPLSAHTGFFGCQHFSQVNAWLRAQNKKEISW